MKSLTILLYVTCTVFFIGGMYTLPLEYAGAFLILLTAFLLIFFKSIFPVKKESIQLFILLGLISISFFLGYTQTINDARFFSEAEKYWGSFLLFAAGFVIVKTIPSIIQTIIRFFAIGLITTSLFGIYFLISNSFNEHVLQRLDTPLGMSNDYSSILIIGLTLFLGFIVSRNYLFSKIIDTMILFFFILCVILARSDAAILGTLVGGYLLAEQHIHSRFKKLVRISACICIVLGIISVFLFKGYFLRSGNAVRLALWKGHTEMILKYPLTGVGLSQMGYHYDQWKTPVPNTKGDRMVPPLDAHSFPLNYTAENGIPSFILLLLFLLYFWKRTVSVRNSYYGLFCGFSAFMFSALFSNHFYMIRQMMFIWFLMGVYLAFIDKKTSIDIISSRQNDTSATPPHR